MKPWQEGVVAIVFVVCLMLFMIHSIIGPLQKQKQYNYRIEYGFQVYYTDSIEHIKSRLEFERDGIFYSIPERGAVVIRQRR